MLDATPFLKLYAKIRTAQLARQNPIQTQEKELLKLIKKAEKTRFGRDHGFERVSSVAAYQARVPLRRWEDFWEQYWKEAFPHIEGTTWPSQNKYFPVTSGTTAGGTKYIPYSIEMQRSTSRAGLDLLTHHVTNRPNSRIGAGKNFVLGGSTALVEEAPGIFSGDLSGIAVKTLPWWARSRYFPPEKIALLSNWEEKIATFADLALKEDIRSMSGVPSWMLILFDKFAEMRPDADRKIAKLFPDLEMVVHGGISFAPYRRQYEEILEGSHAELREVYPASEGFIAIADRGSGEGLRMILDNGIFYEFIPLDELDSENPTRHWIANAEKGVNYAIVLTTCAGCWSYILGDTIKFIDTTVPRILITGRTSYSLSTVGEHLIGEEIEEGLTAASEELGVIISDYSVGSIFPNGERELAGHLYFVEFDGNSLNEDLLARFEQILDETLVKTNEDYEAHRKDNFGLKPPKVHPVKPGLFAAWMKSRGKLGGQHKVPRVINSQELFDNLKEFVENF